MIKIGNRVKIIAKGSAREGMIGEVVDIKKTGEISQLRIQFPDWSTWSFSDREVEKVKEKKER